jgi:glycerol uptake facilitator-like aquaporin
MPLRVGISRRDVPAYIVAHVFGAFIGVGAAHLMFDQSLLQISQHARAGGGELKRWCSHTRKRWQMMTKRMASMTFTEYSRVRFEKAELPLAKGDVSIFS